MQRSSSKGSDAVLVVSTCKYRISEEEFVRPVVEIVRRLGFRAEVVRYADEFNPFEFGKVIICGTALRDFEYLNRIDRFEFIREFRGDLLGICAGYQVIAKVFGFELERVERIGVYGVRVLIDDPIASGSFKAYFLHKLALRRVSSPLIPVAVVDDEICMFRVSGRRIYGISFHPEVLNGDIIAKFLLLC